MKKATTKGVKIITQPGLIDWLKLVAQSETVAPSSGYLSFATFLK